MSNNLEGMVRPFQSPVVTPPIRVPYTRPTARPQNVLLQVGRRPSGKTLSGTERVSITIYMAKYPKEQKMDQSETGAGGAGGNFQEEPVPPG